MKQKKKNKFWTFCFSFIPGAAEMYMGFMKMGLSLMSIFAAIALVTAVLNIGPLVFVATVAWFYSFFHARNFARLDDLQFEQMDDMYVFELNEANKERVKNLIANQKLVAYTLIVIGVYLIWKAVIHTLYVIMPNFFNYYFWGFEETVTRLGIGIAIVYFGLRLIKNRKAELVAEVEFAEQKSKEEFSSSLVQDITTEPQETMNNVVAILQEDAKDDKSEKTSEA